MANPARVNDLEQQLAHLRWKRWQNEREIRTKLNVGRSMRANDTLLKMSIDYAGERAMWMLKVQVGTQSISPLSSRALFGTK